MSNFLNALEIILIMEQDSPPPDHILGPIPIGEYNLEINHNEHIETEPKSKPVKLKFIPLELRDGQRLPPPLSTEPPAKITLSDIGEQIAPGLSIPNVFEEYAQKIPQNKDTPDQQEVLMDQTEEFVDAPQILDDEFAED